MSEKSICESGIFRTLLPTRLPSTDDADDFFFIAMSPDGLDHEHYASIDRPCNPLATMLVLGMQNILAV
jgi:hypothetical protein